ncbi:MAG: hypothetical protein ONB05_09705 [candidate division KSB1 bacterium]|nr:hypothetical protein [candidate division KSB1 bacterium]
MHSIKALDESLFRYIFEWNGRPYLDSLMKFVTRTGDGFLWPVLGLLFLLFERDAGVKILLSGMIGGVVFAFTGIYIIY